MSKIQYNSQDEFYDGIEELTKRGLLFEANARDLTVRLTGGY